MDLALIIVYVVVCLCLDARHCGRVFTLGITLYFSFVRWGQQPRLFFFFLFSFFGVR